MDHGVPFALALGLLVAILDLVPIVGATIAAIVVTTVAFISSDSIWPGVVVLVFFVVYQQIENHLLQPLVYGRTVLLSPLVVLIACSSVRRLRACSVRSGRYLLRVQYKWSSSIGVSHRTGATASTANDSPATVDT